MKKKVSLQLILLIVSLCAITTYCSNACTGLAAYDPSTGELVKHKFERRSCGPKDVFIEISYCGICRSDYHQIHGDWGWTGEDPVIPGHEITGVVAEVGGDVTKFAIGDKVGVGCFVDSCRNCDNCDSDDIQYCDKGTIQTYNYDHPTDEVCKKTMGGYSTSITVDEDFVLKIPAGMPMDSAAPLLCAGITVYSPLIHLEGAKEGGKKIGIVGFGGLGHMAVKIGKAMGNEMFVISQSSKKKEIVEALGAKFILASDEDELKANANSLDLILDTVGKAHPLSSNSELLKAQRTYCLLGGIPQPLSDVSPFGLIFKRLSVTGSLVGSIKETQEMLDFCHENGIGADIELISAEKVNEAMEALGALTNEKARFVIDIANSLDENSEIQPLPIKKPQKRFSLSFLKKHVSLSFFKKLLHRKTA